MEAAFIGVVIASATASILMFAGTTLRSLYQQFVTWYRNRHRLSRTVYAQSNMAHFMRIVDYVYAKSQQDEKLRKNMTDVSFTLDAKKPPVHKLLPRGEIRDGALHVTMIENPTGGIAGYYIWADTSSMTLQQFEEKMNSIVEGTVMSSPDSERDSLLGMATAQRDRTTSIASVNPFCDTNLSGSAVYYQATTSGVPGM